MDTKDAYADLLRKSGFRATPGKITLLKTLHAANEPVSIAELSKKLSSKMNTVTIYRALEDLSQSGIVRRVDLQHPHAHYELADPRNHHHHLVCKICGTVEDVGSCSPALEMSVLKKSKAFASIQSHAMEFFGICRKCITK